MAEAALTSIAKSSLQLFTSLAKDEFLLLWHSPGELDKLKQTIEFISDLLQDADKMRSEELSLKNCLSRLRSVMYDADDLFDGLAARVLRKKTMSGNAFSKEVRLFFSESNQLGALFKVAHEVKAIRGCLDDIKENMLLCGFIRQPPHVVAQPFMRVGRNKTHAFVHEEDVIGRDQERTRIINMLLPKDNGETSCGRSRTLSVVAVIGFGGLGKTTLAQYVFNDERVRQGFDQSIWACINDLSNLEHVLIEILASKVGKNQLDLGLQMLQEKLRGIIGRKKFLIVLDDVWDESSGNWLELERILRCGSCGSKVLVTTRSNKVADCLDASKSYRVDLGVLSEESAWSLFVKKAFHRGEQELSEHPELVSLGKKIVHRCGNVPLAIVVVGSLLRSKEKEGKIWSDFLDIHLKGVLSSSDDIKKVLMVSYNDLLPNLKLCFAYCSLFPKDYTFDKAELVRLWVAQGFMKPLVDTEQNMEEVGETYFFYLVERCFFQEVKQYERRERVNRDQYGHTAKMHDLLHDVAIRVAEPESFLLDKGSINRGKSHSLRHISINSEVKDSFDYNSLVSDSKRTLRTLLFDYCGNHFSKSSLNVLLASFRMLRTLHLPHLAVDHISDSIGELIHLRYLDLSGNEKLKHLPKSISKLHYLMIFVLRGCKLLEKLPPKIEKLVSLRQLYIAGCDSLGSLPSGLIALTSLVNLDRLIVDRQSGGLGSLNGLDNLSGSLRIELPQEGWPHSVEDAERSNMWRKEKLKGMVLEWKGNPTTPSHPRNLAKDNEARAVLEKLQPHENLENLDITNYGGEMLSSWFSTLKNVKTLCLSGCDHVEYIEDERKGNLCLPSLETLRFEGMKNLKGWWREEIVEGMQRPCLPKLSEVRISECPELKGQMPWMGGIESLDLEEVDEKLVKELLLVNPNGSSPSSCSPLDDNSKLKKLQLAFIKGLVCLQEGWIRHLTALQSLTIDDCNDLRWVSRRRLAHLTALKHLTFNYSEIGDEDEDEDAMMGNEEAAGMPWKAFQGLKSLRVDVSDRHLVEGLKYLTQLKHLDVRRWTNTEEDGVELQVKGLQNLRHLKVGFDGKTCHLAKAGIQYFHSVTSLTSSDCKELYLGWRMLLVNMKLEHLVLYSVNNVIDVDGDMMTAVEQQSLLLSLHILRGGAKWVDDIPWISLSSLQSLYLWEREEREQMPDGIQHLTSLQLLDIWGCEKVRSLPNWIPKLTSLTRLMMLDCSAEVEKRCERERGEDWPLIRHIPLIYIGVSRRSKSDNETRNEEGDSRKKGWCGGLTLSKFNH